MSGMIEKSQESRTATNANSVQIVRGQVHTITLCAVQKGTVENFSQVTTTSVSARAFVESFYFQCVCGVWRLCLRGRWEKGEPLKIIIKLSKPFHQTSVLVHFLLLESLEGFRPPVVQ